jgi:hypothetical protein
MDGAKPPDVLWITAFDCVHYCRSRWCLVRSNGISGLTAAFAVVSGRFKLLLLAALNCCWGTGCDVCSFSCAWQATHSDSV